MTSPAAGCALSRLAGPLLPPQLLQSHGLGYGLASRVAAAAASLRLYLERCVSLSLVEMLPIRSD
jgi:hypothetical protein